jgi:hypothetical protein
VYGVQKVWHALRRQGIEIARYTLVLDALEVALWTRQHTGRPAEPGLVHHSDAGSNTPRSASPII